jgi:hypothetical protein
MNDIAESGQKQSPVTTHQLQQKQQQQQAIIATRNTATINAAILT